MPVLDNACLPRHWNRGAIFKPLHCVLDGDGVTKVIRASFRIALTVGGMRMAVHLGGGVCNRPELCVFGLHRVTNAGTQCDSLMVFSAHLAFDSTADTECALHSSSMAYGEQVL